MKSKKTGRELVKLREAVIFRNDIAQQLSEEQVRERKKQVSLIVG
jgi:hypothetical protein